MPSQVINLSNSTPGAPAGRVNVHWQGDASSPRNVSASIPSGGPYDIVCSLLGKPGPGAVVMLATFTRAVSFAGNFAGSAGSVAVPPTAFAIYAVTSNGASIGSVTVSTSGAVAFTTTLGAPQSFAAGDRMTIIAPAVQDATLADVAITLAGTR